MVGRVATSLVLAPIVLAGIWFGGIVLAAVVVTATIVATLEYCRLLERGGFRPAWPLAVVGSAALSLAPLVEGTHLGALAIAVLVVAPGAYFLARGTALREALVDWGLTVLAGFAIGWPLAQANVLRAATEPVSVVGQDVERGSLVLLICALGTWASDTGAFSVGRAFGRHPFFPHISPRKTVEGAAAGVLAPTLVTVLLAPPLGWPTVFALVCGACIGAAAVAGDLVESGLKRAVEAKDAGSWLPGHGGLLDRIDGQIFVLVTVALMTGYIWP